MDTIFYHCEKGNNDTVINLLENQESSLDLVSRFGETILNVLIKNSNYELLKKVLKYDAVKELINLPSSSVLVDCVNRDTEYIDLFLENGADPNVCNIKYGLSPLQYACYFNNVYIIDRLIQCKVDVNYQNLYGKTALFYVSTCNVLQKLLVYGCDPNIKDNLGNTPLHDYLSIDHSFPSTYIMETNDFNTRYDILKELLKYGVNVNIPNNKGIIPLMLSQYSDEIFIMLLKNGADPYITDNENRTSIDYLLEYINSKKIIRTKLIKHLNKHNIHLKMRDFEGNLSPLDIDEYDYYIVSSGKLIVV